jgi:hypothetical protein
MDTISLQNTKTLEKVFTNELQQRKLVMECILYFYHYFIHLCIHAFIFNYSIKGKHGIRHSGFYLRNWFGYH